MNVREVEDALGKDLSEIPKKEPAKKKRKKIEWSRIVFIVSMLAIPIISWLIFWLYGNFNMILMAFQTPTGEWTFRNFVTFWHDLTAPYSEVGVSVRNTFLYFGLNVLMIS